MYLRTYSIYILYSKGKFRNDTLCHDRPEIQLCVHTHKYLTKKNQIKMMYTYEGLYYRITSNNTKSIDIIIIERFQFLGCQIDSRPAENAE